MIHILIVDDETDTHLLYKLKFRKLFADVKDVNLVFFLSGPECLSYLQRKDIPPVDLVLTDINMPDMDGFEVLQKIQELNPKIPVYMVSAYESPEFRIRAEQLGAARFLSKPVDFHLLTDMLRKDLSIH